VKAYLGDPHVNTSRDLGIPCLLLAMIDTSFDHLQEDERAQFGAEVLESIPVGEDLRNVWVSVALWILVDHCMPVARQVGHPAVKRVAELWACELLGDRRDWSVWERAKVDAWAAYTGGVASGEGFTVAVLQRAAYACKAAWEAARCWKHWLEGSWQVGPAVSASRATENQKEFWPALAARLLESLRQPAKRYEGPFVA